MGIKFRFDCNFLDGNYIILSFLERRSKRDICENKCLRRWVGMRFSLVDYKSRDVYFLGMLM